MSPTNDNAMARFLFAILQQKCLKDIDWNKVAHNPILSQEITNGHAARMRFSRFRASVLGIEPQRRNRNSKSKVTKSKKDNKTKKEKQESIKAELNTALDACGPSDGTPPQAKIETFVKQEPHPPRRDNPLTPADLPPVSMAADTQIQFHQRLMTPSSDTELFAPAAHGFATNTAADILQQETTFDYTGPAVGHCSHDQASWQPSPSYSPFALPSYEIENFSTPAQFCEHQHTPHPEGFGIVPSAMMGPDNTHIPVKHEEWDTRFH